MTDSKELLFSFFTRENPNGDSWVCEGFGPMRRKIDEFKPKTPDGKWNYSGPWAEEWSPNMSNPDKLICTFEMPLEQKFFNEPQEEKITFDLIPHISQTGSKWLEACEKYLAELGKKMPSEMPFEIQISEMPALQYVEEEGFYRRESFFTRSHDLWQLKPLPEEMIYGTFHPALFDVPWGNDKNKIGMRCNGGILTPSNQRWKYTAQEDTGAIYLSVPWTHQLIGEMPKSALSGEESDWHLHDSDFPRTHFLEYVFSQHCKDEKNPCPAIRIELKPKNLELMTLKREKQWEEENKMYQERRRHSCPTCLRHY